MAKKRAKQKEVGKIPPPYPLAMVVCDNIHRDPGSAKLFLLGCFSTIHAVSFPATHGVMGLYVELTNGRGTVPLRIRLVDANEDREPLWEENHEVEFPDPRMVMQLVSLLAGITFPEPGEYRFQIFASGEFLMERATVFTSVMTFEAVEHLLVAKPLRGQSPRPPLSQSVDADDLAAMEAAKKECPPRRYAEFRREMGL
jgi:hypothetical protein